MKNPSLYFLSFLLVLLLTTACKKNSNCGCDARQADSYLKTVGGYLSYDQYKQKWVLNYVFERAFRFYYPCNTDQDSLRAVLQTASQNQTFMVSFSGQVKSPCQDEIFESWAPYATYNYILLDSFRRYQWSFRNLRLNDTTLNNLFASFYPMLTFFE